MGDAAAVKLRADLACRDWRAAQEFLSTIQHHDDRAFYLQQAGDVDGVEEWVQEWVDAEPVSNTPLLVAGQRFITWAWQARSAHRARYVGREQFELFFQRLRRAEAALQQAARRDPDDPTPWAFMVTTARGLQLGQAEAFGRFREATARYPWHLAAHTQMLQQVCPKWGGSYEALHAFARRAIVDMPDGCSLGVLSAYAHMEHWMELGSPEDDAYIRQPAVRADLHTAGDRSVRHPQFVRRPGWPLLHNMFAWTFTRAQDWNAAVEQFDATRGLVTKWPWEYTILLNPTVNYALTRQRAWRRRTRRR
jgi:hypothetical protein